MAHSNERIVKVVTDQGAFGWVIFTAYIGAVIYFFQLDLTFWGFIIALIKAIFWPAYVLYAVLHNLGIS
jgi:hypothetical protein